MKHLLLFALFSSAFGQRTQPLVDQKLTTPIIGYYAIDSLPTTGLTAGAVAVATDALTAGSCTVDGGAGLSLCRWSGAVWQPVGDGAAGGGFTPSCEITRTNDTTLVVAACAVDVGIKSFSATATTAVISATTDSAYFYLQNGSFVAGTNSQVVTIAGGWGVQTSITAFPDGSQPLYKWSSTSGVWASSAAEDHHAVKAGMVVEAGVGVTSTDSGTTGKRTLAVDTATTPQFWVGTANPTGNCTVGQRYHRTDNNTSWDCTSTNTWTMAGGVTASSSAVFTNKTLDVEATGNVIGTVDLFTGPIIVGSSSTQTLMVNRGATGPSLDLYWTSGADITYSGYPYLVCSNADGPCWISGVVRLPNDWDSSKAIDVLWTWFTSTTSGNVVFQVQAVCVAGGEALSAVFNASTDVVETANGTGSTANPAVASNISTTGCAAGEDMYWRILRDRTHASDTMDGVVAFVGQYTIRMRRSQ